MDIGIIGAGKVGCSFGKYLTEHHIPVAGYYSKTYESAKQAAQFTQTECFADVTDIILASDTLMIATPDDQIREVWDCIARYDIQDYIICHFSGSLSSDVFSGIDKKKAHPCSIHPIYAFSDKNTSYQNLTEAYFTIEGDDFAVEQMTALLERLGNRVIRIKPQRKALYHSAASLVSNHVLGVIHAGIQIMEECGFSEEDAYAALTPLILNNVSTACKEGCREALTGPIERNDVETVDRHLSVLSGNAKEIYESIGNELVIMAKEKNPERDYSSMELRFDID
jgi:predicted short-subunit dehydrogenase-like oxidoreductase (DUF2520 family)